MCRIQQLCLLAGLCAGMPTRAAAQSFANGNFQTGTLSGWTVVNTANGAGAPGSVTAIDIDGPSGVLAVSNAARFSVGMAAAHPQFQRGVEMTQSLSLIGGTQYVVGFDWSAQVASGGSTNFEGGVFSVIVGGAIIAQGAAGTTGTATPHYGHVAGLFTPSVSGPVSVGVRITRSFTVASNLFQYVDNVTIIASPCYANCDGSTTAPALNVLDFACFLNKFAAGDTYANCDNSTIPPTLNVLDFACFLNRFAAGCS